MPIFFITRRNDVLFSGWGDTKEASSANGHNLFAQALRVYVKILTLSRELSNPPERDSINRKIKPQDDEDAN